MRWISLPVSASQSRTVRSALPDSARLPSGDSAAPQMNPVCPVKTRSSLPVSASQSRSVWSPPLVKRRLPSADTETVHMALPWPVKHSGSP